MPPAEGISNNNNDSTNGSNNSDAGEERKQKRTWQQFMRKYFLEGEKNKSLIILIFSPYFSHSQITNQWSWVLSLNFTQARNWTCKLCRKSHQFQQIPMESRLFLPLHPNCPSTNVTGNTLASFCPHFLCNLSGGFWQYAITFLHFIRTDMPWQSPWFLALQLLARFLRTQNPLFPMFLF